MRRGVGLKYATHISPEHMCSVNVRCTKVHTNHKLRTLKLNTNMLEDLMGSRLNNRKHVGAGR